MSCLASNQDDDNLLPVIPITFWTVGSVVCIYLSVPIYYDIDGGLDVVGWNPNSPRFSCYL